MIEYKAFELHSHTVNSDGQFTTEALCRAACDYQYDGIAITDHNTVSAMEQVTDALQRETLPVIRGIEWTTFFGHMVVLGADEYVDWRFATPTDIDAYIEKIRAVNGVVGIAHPYAIGSPMCTGCHWRFYIEKWENVNYIEVWSKPFPNTLYENPLSFAMWTELLNRGYHIAATSGRDWHGPDDEAENVHVAATYLGIDDGAISTESARDAIRLGRTYVTGGPALDITLAAGGQSFGLGETAPAGTCDLHVRVDETARRAVWQMHGLHTRAIHIVQGGETIARFPCDGSTDHTFSLSLAAGWVRVELYGDYLGQAEQLLAFSSPLYLQAANSAGAQL